MNCSMQLGLSNTTCQQPLWEHNPVKVVSCPLRLRTNCSSNHKSPRFLLVTNGLWKLPNFDVLMAVFYLIQFLGIIFNARIPFLV